MTKSLLSDLQKKEAFSFVYVRALAAQAGYLTSEPKPDMDSIGNYICNYA